MKINQLWQKHAIYLTQSGCIIVLGQAGCPFQEGYTWVGCHILIRYTIRGEIQTGTSNPVLSKIKSRRMIIALGETSAKLKFVETTWPFKTKLL